MSDTNTDWYKDAIIYQVHVKSFFDSNGDGVGDFRGVIEKLDYLVELGVSAIWMLPFYPSPRRDDGYDIADYRNVHPEYGTIDDLRDLIELSHARGIRVITELVVNHTSDQHPWFQKARMAPAGSPERDFYVWSDSDQRYSGTRVIFCDTEKSNWTWDEEAQAYFWHRFYSHQPDLNFDNPLVMEEVFDVMRFWLDLGVDGLRLDAVPYLVEREGTSNENLVETHDVLKRLRAAMDAHAPGSMLLAEANQWPEDAQQYFGEGDECHMSFHFPLMPRMYMAIAREDRFPITDIMRQTPDIPANCQWAIFLRNHDELTLEMVTSSERDYLWETYASDRRARINLGIRRRLAPLLERDRRRVELMNGLLLSMPGTPVIYYGDEIGMGDNIHLGDRDGVRTPMQWSVDRNGGFSRADTAELVLPPIMDPIYGFQSVNVEAQARDQYSLLNWMRRMLAVRRRHLAFGRGTQRFLYPGNRKVLAYLREFPGADGADETILCVSNLARTAQAVQLDLSEFQGRVLVDIVGGSEFPPAGNPPYLLTLPPFGFFWFLLTTEAAMPTWHVPNPVALPEHATLVVRHEMTDLLSGPPRLLLERDIMPAWLGRRRWFASKGETMSGVRIAYAVPMAAGRDNPLLFAEIEVTLAGGERRERYALPLAAVAEDRGALAGQLALSRIRRGPTVGVLTDAFASDDFAHAMLRLWREGATIPLADGGSLEFIATKALAELDLVEDPEPRRLSAEQSNSSVVLGDAAVLKIVRKVLDGVHPEAEMTGWLTAKGFANIAPLFGELRRVDGEGRLATVALLQGFLRNQGDGWAWTLDYLARADDELPTGQDGDAAIDDVLSGYTAFAAAIGKRLGELHELLSRPGGDENFAPETVDQDIVELWVDAVLEQLDGAATALEAMREWPDEHARLDAEDLLEAMEELRALLPELGQAGLGALQTRVHGDFHLGQVLVVQGDAYLIDFEGEPAKTMAQRRAKSCPMRDVAGLLRSLDYAAATAAAGRVASSEQGVERRHHLIDRFRVVAGAAFLDAYRQVASAAAHRWVSEAAEQSLFDLFLIEKAAYEIRYEAANRPGWIGIPLAGLRAIAQRLRAPTAPAVQTDATAQAVPTNKAAPDKFEHETTAVPEGIDHG